VSPTQVTSAVPANLVAAAGSANVSLFKHSGATSAPAPVCNATALRWRPCKSTPLISPRSRRPA
jgi:hypothetical protein